MERTIAARIAALETSAPVPGVLVTGYARYLSAEGTLKRLGSAVTDDHGMIEIAYDLDEAATGPFSLGVLVTAPEGPMALPGPLYQTAAHAERSHPGAQEMFLVRIPDKALQGAQVEAPLVDLALPASAATVGHRLRASFSHQAAVAAEAQVLAKEHIGRAREQMNQLESAIRTQLQTGVRVAGDEGVVPAGRYVVMPADSVAAVTREVVEQGLERHFRDATRPGQLVLPPEQAASLVADSWPAADIEALLFGTHQAEGTALSLVRRDVLLAECRDRTLPVDRCPDTPAEGETQPSGETGDPSTPVEDPALPAEADHASILRKVQELIGRAGSFPGSLDDIAHRPDLGQVDARVAGFHLRSGPADTTAVFDYDTLQIAFDHVWREAFDEDLIDTAMDLYNEIVLLGGTPPAGRVAESDYLSMLRAEVRTLANASLARPAAGRAALRRGTRMGDHRGEPDGPEPGGLPPPRGHESRPGIPPARPSGGAGQPG
ncbi:MAG: hypothetical protein OEY28_02870, partial [Nitrospira sp.]|nr:hypothetical protein [Nitrospira sp.]